MGTSTTIAMLRVVAGLYFMVALLILQEHRVHSWGKLQTVDATRHPDAVCLDGSPYAFYVNRVDNSSAHSKGWILFFEGGGWCYSDVDCLKRSKSRLGSAKNLSETLNPLQQPLEWFEVEGPLSSDVALNTLF